MTPVRRGSLRSHWGGYETNAARRAFDPETMDAMGFHRWGSHGFSWLTRLVGTARCGDGMDVIVKPGLRCWWSKLSSWNGRYTLPETNSSHLKMGGPLEKDIPIGNHHFLGAMLVSGSVSFQRGQFHSWPIKFVSFFELKPHQNETNLLTHTHTHTHTHQLGHPDWKVVVFKKSAWKHQIMWNSWRAWMSKSICFSGRWETSGKTEKIWLNTDFPSWVLLGLIFRDTSMYKTYFFSICFLGESEAVTSQTSMHPDQLRLEMLTMCNWDQNKMIIKVGTVYISPLDAILYFGELWTSSYGLQAASWFSWTFRIIQGSYDPKYQPCRERQGPCRVELFCKQKQMNEPRHLF